MPKQIGWSNESNLLYTISSQISRLAGIIATSGGGGGGGGTITGGGASGQVTFWDAATNITGSNNLFWNNALGRLGIGINTPSDTFAIGSGGVNRVTLNASALQMYNATSIRTVFLGSTSASGQFIIGNNGNNDVVFTGGGFKYIVSGNFGIGSSTDDTVNRLQVAGNAKISGDLSILANSSGSTISSYNATSSTIFLGNTGSGTVAFELQTGSTRRFRIFATSVNTTFESSNQTGSFIFNNSVNISGGDLTVAGVLRETVTTNRQTASYTLALTDRGKLVETNVGAANTITVPPNSSITFPIGTKIDIAQYGAGQTTIVPGIGVTVRSAGGALKLSAQYSGATIVKIGTDEWYLFGDITV